MVSDTYALRLAEMPRSLATSARRAAARANTSHASPALKAVGRLTPRECAVLDLVAQGLSNREAAETLGIACNTVGNHLHSAFGKLGVSSRIEVVWLLLTV